MLRGQHESVRALRAAGRGVEAAHPGPRWGHGDDDPVPRPVRGGLRRGGGGGAPAGGGPAWGVGGARDGGCNEHLTRTRPDVIAAIHDGYLEAGADLISTNTFG